MSDIDRSESPPLSRPVHETHLEIPFPVGRGVAVIRVPKEGLAPEDAQRMAEMVATIPMQIATEQEDA